MSHKQLLPALATRALGLTRDEGLSRYEEMLVGLHPPRGGETWRIGACCTVSISDTNVIEQ